MSTCDEEVVELWLPILEVILQLRWFHSKKVENAICAEIIESSEKSKSGAKE